MKKDVTDSIEFQGVFDDALEMARTLREIKAAVGDIVMCRDRTEAAVVEPICRILMSCYAPYETRYVGMAEKAALVKRARLVLDAYGKEVEEFEKRLEKARKGQEG